LKVTIGNYTQHVNTNHPRSSAFVYDGGDICVEVHTDNGEILVKAMHPKEHKCWHCYQPYICIKPGLWMCPGLEYSGLHGYTFGADDRQQAFDDMLEMRGTNRQEYRDAVKRHYGSGG
jgi:hypothetical protein